MTNLEKLKEIKEEMNFLRECIVYMQKHTGDGKIAQNTAYNWFILRYCELDDLKKELEK